eukprot:Gb_13837 [translate_table: standard]
MSKEMIIQKLCPSCEETNVWNKSNSFIINRIANEGSKWVARIMARRLIWVEASTYLSHQWVAIVVKVIEGRLYTRFPWLVDRFKKHCLASQMFRHPFPMPSLLVIICMDALGPLRWINPDDQPQLNSYLRLRRKRGDTKDKVDSAYLGRIYLMLWWLNDGPKRSRKLLENIKKQRIEVWWIEDDETVYVSLIVVLDGTLTTQFVGKLLVGIAQELTTRVEELELEMEIGKLGALPSIKQATMATKAKLSQLESKVTGLRGQIFGDNIQLFEKEKIIDEMQLEVEQKDQEVVEYIKGDPAQLVADGREPKKSQFTKLTEMYSCLASSKVALEEGYQELSGVIGSEQQAVEECPLPFRSQIFMIPSSIEIGEKASEAAPMENQPGLLGDTSLSTRDEIPESARETVVLGTDRGPRTIMPSVEGECVPPTLANQPEGQPPGSLGRELEAGQALTILHLPNLFDVDKLPIATGPSQGSEEPIDIISLAPLLVIPLGFPIPHTSPQAHYELPLSGTSDMEHFEVVPSIAYADSTTSPSTPKGK